MFQPLRAACVVTISNPPLVRECIKKSCKPYFCKRRSIEQSVVRCTETKYPYST